MPRIEVLLTYDDGREVIVNAGVPKALISFHDEHGHDNPESFREVAWLVHKAIDDGKPLDKFIDSLWELTTEEDALQQAADRGVARPTPPRVKSGGKSQE